jgi:hypothetical protein
MNSLKSMLLQCEINVLKSLHYLTVPSGEGRKAGQGLEAQTVRMEDAQNHFRTVSTGGFNLHYLTVPSGEGRKAGQGLEAQIVRMEDAQNHFRTVSTGRLWY